jgi:excisionase family DNA binding protein
MSASKSVIAARVHFRRGLAEGEAALYIGLSASKFRELVVQGVMPRPRLIGRRRVWDVDDLDAAFKSLPIEGEPGEIDTWSDVPASSV